MKFHFALLGVLCTHALAGDENNKELKAVATSTNATWNDAVLYTDLKSALFERCITSANTKKEQYYFISDPAQGIGFVVHEVNSFEKGLHPVIWTSEMKCTDILDCSRAAKDSAMFQYNGTTCRMTNTTYSDRDNEFCYSRLGVTMDVVYLNTEVPPSGCPTNTDVIVSENDTLCFAGNQINEPIDLDKAYFSCLFQYHGSIFIEPESASFSVIRNYMRNKKYQGEFLVGAEYNYAYGVYYWKFTYQVVNDSYFAVKPKDPFYQSILVISSSHDYLLIPKNRTDLVTGYICVGPPF